MGRGGAGETQGDRGLTDPALETQRGDDLHAITLARRLPDPAAPAPSLQRRRVPGGPAGVRVRH
ncbi:hypothetical protein GCM10009836_15020 [Pseudonocardia ailaonensis]|uniref:Uncharacterized protein n=1 Tax=Pseudonocardia ailaonensis TaxID=367279 RepID=A0ABN2MSL3_9PSEU